LTVLLELLTALLENLTVFNGIVLYGDLIVAELSSRKRIQYYGEYLLKYSDCAFSLHVCFLFYNSVTVCLIFISFGKGFLPWLIHHHSNFQHISCSGLIKTLDFSVSKNQLHDFTKAGFCLILFVIFFLILYNSKASLTYVAANQFSACTSWQFNL